MFHPDGPSFRELMIQALSSTEKGYDLIAKKFDHTPFRTPDPVIVAMAKVIGEPGSIGSALDICCGTGASLLRLRALCKDRVVGLDFSQGMLDEAARRLADAPGDAKVELVRGEALAPPFHEEFDVVTCVGAFGHIQVEDEDRFLAGVHRCLRPGGRFVFVTAPRPPATSKWFWMAHGFNGVMRVRNALIQPQFIMYYLTFEWPEIAAKLTRAGFSVKAHEGICPEPYTRAVIVEATR